MEQRKKQRVEKSTAWTDASILIAEKGGFISPFLKFCHSSRTVKTTQHIQKKEGMFENSLVYKNGIQYSIKSHISHFLKLMFI